MGYTFGKNISDYPEEKKEFFLLPEGKYRLRVLRVEEGTSKSGKLMFTFSFDIAKGEHQGKLLEKPLKKYYVVSTPEQEKYLANFLRLINEENGRTAAVNTFTVEDYENLYIGAKIQHKENEYEGKKYLKPEIHYFIKLSDVDIKPDTDEQVEF